VENATALGLLGGLRAASFEEHSSMRTAPVDV
jgi:LuxR family maltose regulon positive regulatory protein